MSEKNLKKLFPIGTVVTIKELEGRVMIIGHVQKQSGTETIWDYAAVPYPVGLIDPTKFILFNHNKLQNIVFIGLQDAEGLNYMEHLFYKVNEMEIERKAREEKNEN